MDTATFCNELYQIVAQIPSGRVVSYGDLARLAGAPGRARLAGYAMRHAPAGLPCHRVVHHSGRLVPGWRAQRERLEAEGVRFRRNGCVDMTENGWLQCEEKML